MSEEPKVFKVPQGFWYCNDCGEEWDNKEDAENCYEEDCGGCTAEGDETPYQRYKIMVLLAGEEE
jgi:hypothetical protein